jgi:hypothetical protein
MGIEERPAPRQQNESGPHSPRRATQMIAEQRIAVKPLSNAAKRLVILDTAQMVAEDLDRAEREHDTAEVELCERELQMLTAELASLSWGC